MLENSISPRFDGISLLGYIYTHSSLTSWYVVKRHLTEPPTEIVRNKHSVKPGIDEV